jgi:hypothetical protein
MSVLMQKFKNKDGVCSITPLNSNVGKNFIYYAVLQI